MHTFSNIHIESIFLANERYVYKRTATNTIFFFCISFLLQNHILCFPKRMFKQLLPTVRLCCLYRIHLVDCAACKSVLTTTRNTRSMWTILTRKKHYTTPNVRHKFCYFLIFFIAFLRLFLCSFRFCLWVLFQ